VRALLPTVSRGLLYFSHATGFCKETWAATIDELGLSDGQMVAWDYPAHGSGPPASHPIDWWDLAGFALEQVTASERDAGGAHGARIGIGHSMGGAHGARIGIGHSMGAAALAMAEILAPGTFDRLVLVEPIVFPGPKERMPDIRIARAARRRRNSFESRDAAYENFMSKTIFSSWDPRAMAGYVEGGLRPEGDHFVLSCAPSDEAEVFAMAGAHGAFERLGEVQAPVHIVAGAKSTTHPPEIVDVLTKQFQQAESTIIADAGHFVPMEKPAELAELILRETGVLK